MITHIFQSDRYKHTKVETKAHSLFNKHILNAKLKDSKITSTSTVRRQEFAKTSDILETSKYKQASELMRDEAFRHKRALFLCTSSMMSFLKMRKACENIGLGMFCFCMFSALHLGSCAHECLHAYLALQPSLTIH